MRRAITRRILQLYRHDGIESVQFLGKESHILMQDSKSQCLNYFLMIYVLAGSTRQNGIGIQPNDGKSAKLLQSIHRNDTRKFDSRGRVLSWSAQGHVLVSVSTIYPNRCHRLSAIHLRLSHSDFSVIIQRVMPAQMIVVYSCDYGDIFMLTINNLRPLSEQFLKLPQLAIKAKLSGEFRTLSNPCPFPFAII